MSDSSEPCSHTHDPLSRAEWRSIGTCVSQSTGSRVRVACVLLSTTIICWKVPLIAYFSASGLWIITFAPRTSDILCARISTLWSIATFARKLTVGIKGVHMRICCLQRRVRIAKWLNNKYSLSYTPVICPDSLRVIYRYRILSEPLSFAIGRSELRHARCS
jgi:hypothetical protein